MPLAASKKPDGNKWRKEPILQTRGSKFIKFQEARIQVRLPLRQQRAVSATRTDAILLCWKQTAIQDSWLLVTSKVFRLLHHPVQVQCVPISRQAQCCLPAWLHVYLQEMPDEVPPGATPRCINVHLRGDITRSMKAGDTVILGGIFLPEPFSGWKALR
jgi:DNA replicative helicase MCM subunit Mcm2 (Cdc46/Mcm family)